VIQLGALEYAGTQPPWIGNRGAMACPVCGSSTGVLAADLSMVCTSIPSWVGGGPASFRDASGERPGCGHRLHLCRWCGLRRVSETGGEMACAACGRKWETKA
jgi:hypothetical protein